MTSSPSIAETESRPFLVHRGLVARVWFDADTMRLYAHHQGEAEGLAVDAISVDELVASYVQMVDAALDDDWQPTREPESAVAA
jgi:hypothetical protein